MADSKFVLILGVAGAVGLLVCGLSGVLGGKVLGKSYGRRPDGRREFSRYVLRIEEPVWFWVLCGTYIAVGVALLLMVILVGLPAFIA